MFVCECFAFTIVLKCTDTVDMHVQHLLLNWFADQAAAQRRDRRHVSSSNCLCVVISDMLHGFTLLHLHHIFCCLSGHPAVAVRTEQPCSVVAG